MEVLSDSSRLVYWLNSIRMQVGNSVEILVVGTHLDTFQDSADVTALFQNLTKPLQRYRIRGYFAVSSLTGAGVAELKRELAKLPP